MVILEGEQAIQYLQRARSCLHPEVDSYSGIQLLSKMLDIEVWFLENLRNSPDLQKMACVHIDTTGFPEFGSWVADINQVLTEFDETKLKRTKSLLPLFQHFRDASIPGLGHEFEKIAAIYGEDDGITKIVSKISVEQRKYFAEVRPQDSPKVPGLLNYTSMYNKIFVAHYPDMIHKRGGELGFKYIDSQNPNIRAPHILLWKFNEDGTILENRILAQNFPLLNRCKQEGITQCDRGHLHPAYYLETFTALPDSDLNCGLQKESVMFTEERLNKLLPSIKRAFISMDTASLSEPELGHVLQSVADLDQYLKEVIQFFDTTIESYTSAGPAPSLNKKLKCIFQLAPTDEIRMVLQIAIAEALAGSQEKIEKAVESITRKEEEQQALSVPQPEPKPRKKWLGIL